MLLFHSLGSSSVVNAAQSNLSAGTVWRKMCPDAAISSWLKPLAERWLRQQAFTEGHAAPTPTNAHSSRPFSTPSVQEHGANGGSGSATHEQSLMMAAHYAPFQPQASYRIQSCTTPGKHTGVE